MAINTFIVNRNIHSLEEIVDEAPEGTTRIKCFNNSCTSLRGIDRLPSITKLDISKNQIKSLEGIAGSNVTTLYIIGNQIRSLEGLAGSKVSSLYINNNQISSLEGIADSNVTKLIIWYNQITSLEGLAGSKVTNLYIQENPCYKQFINEFDGSIEKVKERYEFDEIKEPAFD